MTLRASLRWVELEVGGCKDVVVCFATGELAILEGKEALYCYKVLLVSIDAVDKKYGMDLHLYVLWCEPYQMQ